MAQSDPATENEPVRVRPEERPSANNSRVGKTIVLTLVERHTGRSHSRVIPDVTGATVRKAIAERVDMPATTLHTLSGVPMRPSPARLPGTRRSTTRRTIRTLAKGTRL